MRYYRVSEDELRAYIGDSIDCIRMFSAGVDHWHNYDRVDFATEYDIDKEIRNHEEIE